MTTAPSARPIEHEVPDATERFQRNLLLILGLALIGAAAIALGFAARSPAGVAIGAGIILAAGAISIFTAVARSKFYLESSDATEVNSRAASDSRMPVAPDLPDELGRTETSRPNGPSPTRPRELFDPELRDRLFRPN